MRRTDREITDHERIRRIILACDCCRLGLTDGDSTYVVPLNFGYTTTEAGSYFYFHCAQVGKKLDLIRQNPNVGFELDTNHALNEDEKACGYSFRFQSVIGKGYAELIHDTEEKKAALASVMRHYTQRADWVFTQAEAESVAVIRLTVREMACKEHL